MADGTKIEWTDATWTPVKGCTRVSPGCGGPGPHGGCYAEIMAARFSKPGQWGEGLAKIVTLPDGSKDHRWTGVIRFDERELLKPLSWRRPRRIFVCSTADLFHAGVTDEQIDKVFAVMALCPQHTFQVLTKRPERMREYLTSRSGDHHLTVWSKANAPGTLPLTQQAVEAWLLPSADDDHRRLFGATNPGFPLPHAWLGTSVEDQQRADERIPHLLATPATVRFLSCEPLLGALNLTRIITMIFRRAEYVDPLNGETFGMFGDPVGRCPKLDWIIVGGESGPGARPMHPEWARSLRDQCAAAGVAFFFKQWGEWYPVGRLFDDAGDTDETVAAENALLNAKGQEFEDGTWWTDPRDAQMVDTGMYNWTNEEAQPPGDVIVIKRIGKKRAGRLLDGVEHNGMPA